MRRALVVIAFAVFLIPGIFVSQTESGSRPVAASAARPTNSVPLVSLQGVALPHPSGKIAFTHPSSLSASLTVTVDNSGDRTGVARSGMSDGITSKTGTPAKAGGKIKGASPLKPPARLSALSNHSPRFIENRGQFDRRVRYQLRTGGGTAWLTNTGVVFDFLRAKPPDSRIPSSATVHPAAEGSPASLGALLSPRPPFLPDFLSKSFSDQKDAEARLPTHGKAAPDPRSSNPESRSIDRLVFSEDFVGARGDPQVEPKAAQPGIYNYFIGNDPKKWVTHVAAYSEVAYRDLWPGINLRLYRSGPNIEQEFVLKPGADLTTVQVAYKGIDGLRVADDGALVVKTAFGELRETKPRLYQEIAGQRVPVEGRFKITGEFAYTFEVKSSQPEYALVIDPTLLYSTYLGGGGADSANGVAVDASGNAYLTGTTLSTDFPTTSGAFQSSDAAPYGYPNVFVTKLNPLGSQPVYSTYLGGTAGATAGRGIALDSAGEAYVTGTADSGFPTTGNAYQTGCGASAFITELNANGDGLVYSSCFGDEGYSAEYGAGPAAIALDSSGRAYITGWTGGGMPRTPNAYQPICGGTYYGDAFVSVVNPSASGTSSLIYSTCLGGTADNYGLRNHSGRVGQRLCHWCHPGPWISDNCRRLPNHLLYEPKLSIQLIPQ